MSDEINKCSLCGEPMPKGEQMFKYHGYSGPCPKPPLQKKEGFEGLCPNLPQAAAIPASTAETFKAGLLALMKQHGVATLTYTIDDDGLHAYLPSGEDWELGFPDSAEA